MTGIQTCALPIYYSLNESQTDELGRYEVKRIYCSDGINNGSSNWYFEITPNGAEKMDSAQGYTMVGVFLVLIVAIFFFLILGIYSKNVPFKLFFVGLSILLMVGTLGFGVTIMQQLFGEFAKITHNFGIFYTFLTILLGGGGAGLMLYLFVIAIKTFKAQGGRFSE